jgi:PAS domain-containing protein
MERGGAVLGTPARTSAEEIVRHAPEGLAVIDARARFVDANPAAA